MKTTSKTIREKDEFSVSINIGKTAATTTVTTSTGEVIDGIIYAAVIVDPERNVPCLSLKIINPKITTL